MATKVIKKPGRPYLPKGKGKNEWIHVRLQPGEKELFERAAKRDNLKLSEWVRQTLKSKA